FGAVRSSHILSFFLAGELCNDCAVGLAAGFRLRIWDDNCLFEASSRNRGLHSVADDFIIAQLKERSLTWLRRVGQRPGDPSPGGEPPPPPASQRPRIRERDLEGHSTRACGG